MPTPSEVTREESAADHQLDGLVLRLVVRNHPGVMSHIAGLFARRGFNVEGIICLPLAAIGRSRILLLVDSSVRLDQLVRQLEKLEDVMSVEVVEHGVDVFRSVVALV